MSLKGEGAFFLDTVLIYLTFSTLGENSWQLLIQGRFTTDEMRIVHSIKDGMQDDGDLLGMEVPDPPVNMHPARRNSDRCNLGSKSYCPGEVLFK